MLGSVCVWVGCVCGLETGGVSESEWSGERRAVMGCGCVYLGCLEGGSASDWTISTAQFGTKAQRTDESQMSRQFSKPWLWREISRTHTTDYHSGMAVCVCVCVFVCACA